MNRCVSKTDEEIKEAEVSGQGASIDMNFPLGE